MVSVYGPHDAWPWLFDGDEPFGLALEFLPGLAVQNDGDDPEEGLTGRTRLDLCASGQGGDDVAASLSLPVGVHHRRILVANILVVP